MCEALAFLLDNVCVRIGSKLYRQIVGIPVGAGCALLVADLFLFCCVCVCVCGGGGGLRVVPFGGGRSGVVGAFNSTYRYLSDLLNIGNNFFDGMVGRICPSGLRLNGANVSDAEASFLDLHLSISDGFVEAGVGDRRDYFDFDVVGFPFLDGDVPRSASCGVCVSRLVRFARVSGRVDDFIARGGVLAAGLPRQGYGYHGLRKAFS